MKKHMPWKARFKHWLYATCVVESLLEDYATDTYTCGVCGKRYAAESLAHYGFRGIQELE